MSWSDGEHHELVLPIRLEAWSLLLLVFSFFKLKILKYFEHCPPLSLAFVFVFVISKVHQDEWFKFLKFLWQF